MDTKVWLATGMYKKGNVTKVFSKELLSKSEAHVREKILSELGSRHHVKRKYITITEIKELKREEVRDLDIRKALGIESEM